ncbi:MAG: hypothetical protein WA857_20230 [Candidatus Acidiferrum sp.]
MRTTLPLDDDVLQEVKAYAKSRNIAIGKAISELLRRGLNAPLRTRVVNGFHVVDLPPGSPPISAEDIKKLKKLEQEDMDRLGRRMARRRGTDTKFAGRKRRQLGR